MRKRRIATGVDECAGALAAMLPLSQKEIEAYVRSTEGRKCLLTRVGRALREERRRGIAGHWAYDLARHARLHRAYQRLKLILDVEQRPAGRGCSS